MLTIIYISRNNVRVIEISELAIFLYDVLNFIVNQRNLMAF